jgi:hypothetical protein
MPPRLPGFAAGSSKDEGWVTLKVQVRPAEAEALKTLADEEAERTDRKVYVSDMLRDGVKLVLTAHRRLPGQQRRFQPSPASEPAAQPRGPAARAVTRNLGPRPEE